MRHKSVQRFLNIYKVSMNILWTVRAENGFDWCTNEDTVPYTCLQKSLGLRSQEVGQRGNYTYCYIVNTRMILHSDGQQWGSFWKKQNCVWKPLTEMGTVTIRCQNKKQKKGEPKQGIEPMSLAYQPSAWPLGQTGSQVNVDVWLHFSNEHKLKQNEVQSARVESTHKGVN